MSTLIVSSPNNERHAEAIAEHLQDSGIETSRIPHTSDYIFDRDPVGSSEKASQDRAILEAQKIVTVTSSEFDFLAEPIRRAASYAALVRKLFRCNVGQLTRGSDILPRFISGWRAINFGVEPRGGEFVRGVKELTERIRRSEDIKTKHDEEFLKACAEVPHPNIFINYRRSDQPHAAARLNFNLDLKVSAGEVFFDLNEIQAGSDFSEEIQHSIARSRVLLAVIGSKWASAKFDRKAMRWGDRRRLFNREDYVRLEIEAALAIGRPVIPVLIDGARMPKAHEIPVSIRSLLRRSYVPLSHCRFEHDATYLASALNLKY